MLNVLKKSYFIFILYRSCCKIRVEQNQRKPEKMEPKISWTWTVLGQLEKKSKKKFPNKEIFKFIKIPEIFYISRTNP